MKLLSSVWYQCCPKIFNKIRDARGKPVNLPKDRLTSNVFKNRLTDKNVYIIEIEEYTEIESKIIKRCATLQTKVFNRHERHDDRPHIAINTRVMLVHRARLLIWQVSLTPLF